MKNLAFRPSMGGIRIGSTKYGGGFAAPFGKKES